LAGSELFFDSEVFFSAEFLLVVDSELSLDVVDELVASELGPSVGEGVETGAGTADTAR
jgi:hypothetical protein